MTDAPGARRRGDRATQRAGLLARRLALLSLFEDDFRPGSAEQALERMAVQRGATEEVRRHAAEILAGVAARRPELDRVIASSAPAIPLDELGHVERAILRSALYEVLYSAATPSGETIRDAVSLARIYAGDAARRLVNGVLGSISRSGGGA